MPNLTMTEPVETEFVAVSPGGGPPAQSGGGGSRYVDWRQVGEGGFARVFKVFDTRLNQHAAIKLLKLDAMRNADMRRRMEDGLANDVLAARSLYSKSICPTYDLYDGPEGVGLVMEFIDGIELRKWLNDRKDDRFSRTPECLEVLRSVTAALVEAHAKIIHRDLKPENIMLRGGDIRAPVIMDLGFAVLGSRAGTGGLAGLTPRYAAPEQLERPDMVDHRADLWALGVMAYEFFAGAIPGCALSNTSQQDWSQRKAVRVPWEQMEPPSRRNYRVSPALDRLIRGLLAFDPDDRIASARDVLERLQSITLSDADDMRVRTGTSQRRAAAVAVPGGEYILGSPRGMKTPDNERPGRTVMLSPFLIDRYPVTQEDYKAFAEDTGRRMPGGEHAGEGPQARLPVVQVSYDEAAAFAAWAGGALPTEAQWECAARGGTEYALYPWGDEPPNSLQANIDDPGGGLSPVGACPSGASRYGVEDMCGNVREWCRDVYDPEFYQSLKNGAVDPVNLRQGPLRALRGGSFESLISMGRCAYRDGLAQEERRRDVGFRVAYSINNGEEK